MEILFQNKKVQSWKTFSKYEKFHSYFTSEYYCSSFSQFFKRQKVSNYLFKYSILLIFNLTVYSLVPFNICQMSHFAPDSVLSIYVSKGRCVQRLNGLVGDHGRHQMVNTEIDWLYSLQPKREKLYIVSKDKTGSLLWLRSWTPYCHIQT